MEKKKVSLLELFLTFFKIGAFTFGGGYAMIPIIEREMIDNKKWIKEQDILDSITIAQSVPGAIAINSAILIGYKIHKRLGALVSTIGAALPSLIIIIIVSIFFDKVKDNRIIEAIFMGIRPTIIALITVACIKSFKSGVRDKLCFFLFLLTVVFVMILNVSSIIIIISGIILGIIHFFIISNKGRDMR